MFPFSLPYRQSPHPAYWGAQTGAEKTLLLFLLDSFELVHAFYARYIALED